MPPGGSCRVHIDDDRVGTLDDGPLDDGPLDDGPLDDGPLDDGPGLGVNMPDGERVAESSTLGGYPEVADREPPNPGEPPGGVIEGVSVPDDGVLHTESRGLESLGE